MPRKFCKLIIITAILLICASGQQQSKAQSYNYASAKNIRFGGDHQLTRFVFELSRSVSFNAFVLLNPYRVVIDLPQINFNPLAGIETKPYGIVESFRYGLFSQGKSRIVLDTKSPVKIEKSFLLRPNQNNPARLVLDIKKISESEMREKYALNSTNNTKVTLRKNREIITLLKRNSESVVKKAVIVIDPGHGGIDPGASGTKGVFEKNIVLDFSKKLQKKLRATNRYSVYLTRDSDNFVRLSDRIKIARKYKADLFISIHADALETKHKNIKGATIYNLSKKASDKHAAALAKRENSSDLLAGLDIFTASTHVKSILIDLAQRESKIYSEKFSQILLKNLAEYKVLNKNPRRSAGFYVLKAPDIPSVLLELGYLSNKGDQKRLLSNSFRQQIVNGIVTSVDKYFNKKALYSSR